MTAVSEDVLNEIMSRDPDGGSHQPTKADYKQHQDWAVNKFGPDAWKRYTNGEGWGHQPGDDAYHVESSHHTASGLGMPDGGGGSGLPLPPGKGGQTTDTNVPQQPSGASGGMQLDQGPGGSNLTTKPRQMPGGTTAPGSEGGGDPASPTFDPKANGGDVGAGADKEPSGGDGPEQKAATRKVASKITTIMSHIHEDNPSLTRREAYLMARQVVATYPVVGEWDGLNFGNRADVNDPALPKINDLLNKKPGDSPPGMPKIPQPGKHRMPKVPGEAAEAGEAGEAGAAAAGAGEAAAGGAGLAELAPLLLL